MEAVLSTKQQQFLDAALNGENIFLTGEAGTGKSHVVKLAIEALQKKCKNVVVVAPTGVAATNIGGQTIHSMFSLRPFGVIDFEVCIFVKSEKRRVFGLIDTIVIDEISMLRPDMLDGINWTLLKNGCKGLKDIQLILVGDLEQYPFKLAYALSIHKSQGMTMDEVTLDLTRPCFSRGQMYVALSRVRTPAGLTIITK